MASYEDSVEEDLTCPCCFELFIEPNIPKELDCPHIQCQLCLEMMTDGWKPTIECPECRLVTKLSSDGIEGLKTNIRILSLAEKHFNHLQKRKNSAPKQKTNDDDESGVPKCAIHGGEKVHFYCTTCNMAACQACIVLKHEPRSRHDIKDINEIYTQQKEEMKALLGKAGRSIGLLEKAVREVEDQEENYKLVLMTEEQKIDTLVESVVEQGRLLKDEITKRSAKYLENFERHREGLLQMTAAINIATTDARQARDKSTSHDYVAKHGRLTSQIMSTISKKQTKFEDQYSQPEIIKFKSNPGGLNIGCLEPDTADSNQKSGTQPLERTSYGHIDTANSGEGSNQKSSTPTLERTSHGHINGAVQQHNQQEQTQLQKRNQSNQISRPVSTPGREPKSKTNSLERSANSTRERKRSRSRERSVDQSIRGGNQSDQIARPLQRKQPNDQRRSLKSAPIRDEPIIPLENATQNKLRKLHLIQEIKDCKRDLSGISVSVDGTLAVCSKFHGIIQTYYKKDHAKQKYSKKMHFKLPVRAYGPQDVTLLPSGDCLVARMECVEIYGSNGVHKGDLHGTSGAGVVCVASTPSKTVIVADKNLEQITVQHGSDLKAYKISHMPDRLAPIMNAYIAIASREKGVCIMDLKTGKPMRNMSIPKAYAICYDKRTNCLLVGRINDFQRENNKGVIEQYSCINGDFVARIATGLVHPRAMAFLGDGLLAVADANIVKIFTIV